nr:MAG TPA: hypothetical protein [Caudoviricetes sp.]
MYKYKGHLELEPKRRKSPKLRHFHRFKMTFHLEPS